MVVEEFGQKEHATRSADDNTNTTHLPLPDKGQDTMKTSLDLPMGVHQLLGLQSQHHRPLGDFVARQPTVALSSLFPRSVALDNERLLQMIIKKEQEHLIQSQLRQNLILQLSQPQPQSLALALAHHHIRAAMRDQPRPLVAAGAEVGVLNQERPIAIPNMIDVVSEVGASVPETGHKARRSSGTDERQQSSRAAAASEDVASAKHTTLSGSFEDSAAPSPRVSSKLRTKATKWLQTYDRLKKYRDQYGDCIVPRGYAADPSLASWVAEQRKQHKLFRDGRVSSITPERIQMLQDIDFTWSAQEAAWDRSFNHLAQFKAKNGHCQVPLNHPEFPKLGLWIKEQRRHYSLWKRGQPSHMTRQRATRLDSLGFCWDTHEAAWTERFEELALFKEQTGSCIVTTTDPKYAQLATWVQHQRRQYRKFHQGKASHITQNRIEALESLGFVWYPRKKSRRRDSLDVSMSESDEETTKPLPSKRPRTEGY